MKKSELELLAQGIHSIYTDGVPAILNRKIQRSNMIIQLLAMVVLNTMDAAKDAGGSMGIDND